MATTYKISELDELTDPAADDDVEIRDVSDNVPVATGKSKRVKWLTLVTKMFASRYGADAGSNDTYVVTLSPAPPAYATGEHYRFKANTANTGACTVNFNSLGAKTIKKAAGGVTTDLDDNDIRAGQWVDLVYDGTNMQMQSLLGNAPAGGTGGFGDVVGPGSSTDNALARFDSTTGKLIQDSTVTLDDTGALTVPEMVAPGTPGANKVAIYAKSDGKLYIKDDAGTETDLTASGGGGATANSTTGSVPYLSAANTFSDSPMFREDANTIAHRNSTTAQTLNLYQTFTDASNYARLRLAYDGSNFYIIKGEKAGTGSAHPIQIAFDTTTYSFDGDFYPSGNGSQKAGKSGNKWSEVNAVLLKPSSAVEFTANNTQLTNPGSKVIQAVGILGDSGATFSGGSTTPSQLTSDQNDYNPGKGLMQRWSSNASRTVTGLSISQVDGEFHVIINVGSNDIVLANQSASSTAANRFLNSTGADITLSANQAADVIYDNNTQRWRVFKRN